MSKIFGIVALFFLFLSCSSDLDLDQVNDLKLKPAFVSNFSFFDVVPNQFLVGGVEQPVISDVLKYDIFKDPFFYNNLKKLELKFEINNTITRDYIVDVNYLNSSNQILYSVSINVPAYNGVLIPQTKTELFENNKLDLFKQTRNIEFVVKMLPGPGLSGSSTGRLVMRSISTIYFAVE